MAIIAIKEKVAMQVTLLQRGVIIRIIKIRWVIRMVAVVVLLIVGKTRRRREIKNNFIFIYQYINIKNLNAANNFYILLHNDDNSF